MTSLEAFGRQFADDLQMLIRGTLGTKRAVRAVRYADRVVVRPGSIKPVPVSLARDGRLAARLMFSYDITPDSSGNFPSVTNSKVRIDSPATNRPVLRYEFIKEANRSPTAHWHVHGESTELGRILGGSPSVRTSLSNLHLPVGGSRFRPGLEDVIELLITELRFDHASQWRQNLHRGREAWRSTQLAVAVRDAPETAADALRDLGYKVQRRSPGAGSRNRRRLTQW